MTLSQCHCHNMSHDRSNMRTMGVQYIATIVKCISSRKSNRNSIEFFLSNADKGAVGLILALELASLTLELNSIL